MKSFWLVLAAAFLIVCVCVADGKKSSVVEASNPSANDTSKEVEGKVGNGDIKIQKPVEPEAGQNEKNPDGGKPKHHKKRVLHKQGKRVTNHNNAMKKGLEKLRKKDKKVHGKLQKKLVRILDNFASKTEDSNISKRIKKLKNKLEGQRNGKRGDHTKKRLHKLQKKSKKLHKKTKLETDSF